MPPPEPSENITRLRRLYALARLCEAIEPQPEPCRDAWRQVSLLALDMLAEARAGR